MLYHLKQKLELRLHNLKQNWCNEFRLIQNIWAGEYPKTVKCNLSYLEKIVMCLMVFIRSLSLSHLKGIALKKESRTQISELYVLAWATILILCQFLPASLIIAGMATYRLIEGFNYRLCIIFVDRYNPDWSLRSLNRSLILLLINYFELILGFATLYLYTRSIKLDQTAIADPANAVYFSIITITTLGDVRFTPYTTMGKFLVSVETITGLIFLVIVVSTFISGIPPMSDSKKITV